MEEKNTGNKELKKRREKPTKQPTKKGRELGGKPVSPNDSAQPSPERHSPPALPSLFSRRAGMPGPPLSGAGVPLLGLYLIWKPRNTAEFIFHV